MKIESGALLGVGTVYLPVKEIKGEFYVKVSDFTRCMDSMRKELEIENKNLKEEVEQLKNKRIFSSAEYDLITLTSTTPQWELRPRDENGFYKEAKTIC